MLDCSSERLRSCSHRLVPEKAPQAPLLPRLHGPSPLGTTCLCFWSLCFFAEILFYFQADKKDSQGNNTVSGFEILLQKQLKGKQMQKEMAEFVRER